MDLWQEEPFNKLCHGDKRESYRTKAFGISSQFSLPEEWDDAANLPQPWDDAGADGVVVDCCEVVDDPGSRVFEMDRSNTIRTEGIGGFGGLDGGVHL